MRIRIISEVGYLADALADHLEAQGYTRPILENTKVDGSEILYGSDISQAELNTLMNAVKPMTPKFSSSKEVDKDLVLLKLGDQKSFSDWELKIYVDSESFAEKVVQSLSPLKFSDDIVVKIDSKHVQQEHSLLKYGGATPFARQVIRWFLSRLNVKINEEKAWDKEDDDIWIYIKDPQFEGKDLKTCFEVLVKSDDVTQLIGLKDYLSDAGYEKINIQAMDADDEESPKFSLELGGYKRDDQEANLLKSRIEIFMDRAGIDTLRYPLIVSEDDLLAPCKIVFPFKQYSSGTLRPTTGPYRDRWDVILYTDEPKRFVPLLDSLKDAGYLFTRIEALGKRKTLGCQIHWGAAIDFESVTEEIQELVENQLEELCEELGISVPKIYSSLDIEDEREEEVGHHTIAIELPVKDLDTEQFNLKLKELTQKFELSLKSKKVSEMSLLTSALKSLEFKAFETESESYEEPSIHFGGAPVTLIYHISALVEQYTGLKCQLKKLWSKEDDDIWVQLPTITLQQSPETNHLDLDSWFSKGPKLKKQESFLKITEKEVLLAGLKLPRNLGEKTFAHLIPPAEEFNHYCMDQRTAETVEHIAQSVLLREPCLLEGETSVSKTSAIQYVAMLLNQPLIRLNLNGQTDTGELIGKFIPQAELNQLPIPIEQLVSHRSQLSSDSQGILRQAEQENRGLDALEVQRLIKNEGLPQKAWNWQNGLIVQAMIHGWWVVLDELNLAEPQILERLNSLLERNPSLVLTEYDHQMFGNGGQRIHPNFRLFATMNPAEYAGRSALSPAYRDRWRGYKYVQSPTEEDYYAMLNFLVTGQNPSIRLYGKSYQGNKIKNPPFAQLAKQSNINAFLKALSQFHCALEIAVGRRGGVSRLGAHRKDRYVFTRRGLLSIMDYLVANLHASQGSNQIDMRLALTRYYLSRCTNGSDQNIVMQLMNAAGIGLNTWKI